MRVGGSATKVLPRPARSRYNRFMNYLVHLHLSDPDPLCRVGNLMGDFVKGRLEHHDFPPMLLRGLRQHRAVDRLSHDHPAVRASKACLADRFGILKPVLVDIFYDHLLARNWGDWGSGRLEGFVAEAYQLLESHWGLLVPEFRLVARRMIDHDWLTSYRDPAVIELVLQRMSGRLRRQNRLAEGYGELARCRTEMERHCLCFLEAARNLPA